MAKPFLKWVGGKHSILPELLQRMPKSDEYETYHEPFVGGGALFFAVEPTKAVLSDVNKKLINAFNVIKTDPELVMNQLQILQDNHSKEVYQDTVAMYNRTDLDEKAYGILLIYLNKTCFNGLYRENKSGGFNVPIGKYDTCKVFDRTMIMACNKALQNADIKYHNFIEKQAHNSYNPRDFYYIDPPYYRSYAGYSASSFGEYEHFKLYRKCKELHDAGCRFMMSNSDEPLIRDLYRDFNIEVIEAKRSISCKGSSRTKKQELIIRNYA